MRTVSIIIPCYNQAQWLGEAIDSCLNQTVKPLEIIVVDDCSPDNILEVIKKYSPVKYIRHEENLGLSAARNTGIRVSKGTHIITLDSDDKLHPEFIEKCLNTNDDIVSTLVQEFGESKAVWIPPFKHPTAENFKQQNCINCCSLFKKEIFDKIGGYDEDMRLGYEDWDVNIRATMAGYTVTVIPEFLFFYRKHGSSLVDVANKNKQKIREYMCTKY